MLYSASKNGFYSREIHGDKVPADVVEITTEEHAELLAGQAAGQVITAGTGGKPVLRDQPAPTAEQLQAIANAKARAYLASTDWYVIRLQETGEAIPEKVIAERAAARISVVEV